jgi:hypothetical protein
MDDIRPLGTDVGREIRLALNQQAEGQPIPTTIEVRGQYQQVVLRTREASDFKDMADFRIIQRRYTH